MPSKRVLFRINSYGDRFYIVLKGIVNVLVDDNGCREGGRMEYEGGEVIEDLELY